MCNYSDYNHTRPPHSPLLYGRTHTPLLPFHPATYPHSLPPPSNRDMKTATGEDVFLNCISELALHSREFDQLLGKLGEDGTRSPGLVDGFSVSAGGGGWRL